MGKMKIYFYLRVIYVYFDLQEQGKQCTSNREGLKYSVDNVN